MGRFILFERIIWFFLIFNIVFQPINEDIFNYFLPKEINGYMYWFSIGLFFGYQLYKYSINKYWKNLNKTIKHKGSLKK